MELIDKKHIINSREAIKLEANLRFSLFEFTSSHYIFKVSS